MAALEAQLQVPIPVSVRAIYRLHNGQDEVKVLNTIHRCSHT
jgi:cell wall assembly regulator SMI1